jgi:hypothetical protein
MLTNQDICAMDSFIVFIPENVNIFEKIEEHWEEIHEVLGNRYDVETNKKNRIEQIEMCKSFLNGDLISIRNNNTFEYFDYEELVKICDGLGFLITGVTHELLIQNIAYGSSLQNIKKLLGDKEL